MNERRKPIIKTWQEFEERVLELNSRDWKSDPQKFHDEMTLVRRAFVEGAKSQIEREVRLRQVSAVGLTQPPTLFFSRERLMKHQLFKAQEITAASVKKELQFIAEEERRLGLRPAKKKPQKAAKTSPAIITKGQVTTDRVFNMLYNDPDRRIRIVGDFNYKVKWIHDCFTHILKKEYVDKAPKLKEAIFRPEDKDKILAHINEFRSYLPQLKFTDAQFRKITGLKKVSGEEINQLVESYRKLDIKGEIFSYWDKEINRWIRASFSGSIADVLTLETGKISPRGNKPEHEYCFSLNAGGFLLFHNLLHRRYKSFPKDFYQLRGGAQDIYRYVAQFNASDLLIRTMSKILGYGETKNISERKKRIDYYLNELKENGFIKDWSRRGRGQKTVYHIKRI
jgi:hypothetical protein